MTQIDSKTSIYIMLKVLLKHNIINEDTYKNIIKNEFKNFVLD